MNIKKQIDNAAKSLIQMADTGASYEDKMQRFKIVLRDFYRKGAGESSEIQGLVTLLEMAVCPTCNGDGAYYDGMGNVCQCQWCYERDLALTAYKEGNEANNKKFLLEEPTITWGSIFTAYKEGK